jgi:hypothetical protein
VDATTFVRGGETGEGVRRGIGGLEGLEFCGENGVWMAEDRGFCAAEGGDYDVGVIVFVDLQEGGEILIVERVTLLFKTTINSWRRMGVHCLNTIGFDVGAGS